MLFSPSFTQSESFLILTSSPPDFGVLNQQRVVVMINFIRKLSGSVIVNVFKSDAVIWWAAIFRTFPLGGGWASVVPARGIPRKELLFGLMGRIHHSSGDLGNMVHVDDTGDDGSFFLSQS